MSQHFSRVARHALEHPRPAVNFFSGAVLGNGGLGVILCARPDAVVAHFGHNNVWDIRIAEKNREKLGTFPEIFAKVKAIDPMLARLDEDPWYRQYCKMASENYGKIYPRPMPCGSLVLGLDRRRTEVLGYRLDIASGQCGVALLHEGRRLSVRAFVEQAADQLLLAVVDDEGQFVASPFERIRILPDPSAAKDMPPFAAGAAADGQTLSLRQVLPALEPDVYDAAAGHPKDRAFRLSVRVSSKLEEGTRRNWDGNVVSMGELERGIVASGPLVVVARLEEGLAAALSGAAGSPAPADVAGFQAAARQSSVAWENFWERSAVALDDQVLEAAWYRNLYFLRCSMAPGARCPGLFGNWSYGSVGTAWHGDWHMNYNTQQPFWAVFTSNHAELHLPYVELVEHVLPVSQKWAGEYYGLRGAYFPHSAYPVEMTMMPYPVPTWGWEICETPWTVQSLWWHYLYTHDVELLRTRLFPPIKEAVLFLVDYMLRPEAHGTQWGDDRYHVFPTVPPELYGLRPGFRGNADCLVDLTLIRFVFRAFLQGAAVLGIEEQEQELLAQVDNILHHFPEYPTAPSPRGEVFVTIKDEDPETVYNLAASTASIFPGDEHGLFSPPRERDLAINSLLQQRNEGGNDLVMLNLQKARLGMLDLAAFARQINYCLLPNGTCSDLCLQVHGRYNDHTPFDFMERMGLWIENFALPAVINECLLQSYHGMLHLFPNWKGTGQFRQLRAVGALLVDAEMVDGVVSWAEVLSETGTTLRLVNPWPGSAIRCRSWAAGAWGQAGEHQGTVVRIATKPGERLRVERA